MVINWFTSQDFLKSVLDKFRKAQQQLHASHGIEHDWNLLQTCISLLECIGDFRLRLSEFETKIIVAVHEKKNEMDGDLDISYLCTNYRICGKRELNEFKKLVKNTQTLSSFESRAGIFSSVYDIIRPICEYVHDTTFSAIFTPIENHLKGAQLESEESIDMSGNDLPDYSFAPQEYITVIGQVREWIRSLHCFAVLMLFFAYS